MNLHVFCNYQNIYLKENSRQNNYNLPKNLLLGVNADIDADSDSVLLKMHDPSSYITTVTVKWESSYHSTCNTDNRNCTDKKCNWTEDETCFVCKQPVNVDMICSICLLARHTVKTLGYYDRVYCIIVSSFGNRWPHYWNIHSTPQWMSLTESYSYREFTSVFIA